MAPKSTATTRGKGDLLSQVKKAQAQVKPDGYEMSLGEMISIYERGEIVINPEYQRLFRWSSDQKSKFIESILIGIPVPPVFVFQTDDGKWELVDGLQRLSTIFEFRGVLRHPGQVAARPASILSGTSLMPALEGVSWEKTASASALPEPLKLKILRSRLRVEILQTGSSPRSRFELFQRLNTGGSLLTRQEIRNCSVVMIDPSFHAWLVSLANDAAFKETTGLTEAATERQRPLELVTKYFVCNLFSYKSEWDVHDYLDEGIASIALDKNFDRRAEADLFRSVFSLIQAELGERAFRRVEDGRIVGSFSDAAFEALAVGVRQNLGKLQGNPGSLSALEKAMWADAEFKRNTGAGVRGTQRVSRIIPFARLHFQK